MALLFLLRTRTRNNSLRNPSLIHLFSTSSSNSNSNDDEPDSSASDDRASSNSHSHIASYFSDVKKVLKQHPSSTLRSPSTPSFTASGSVPQSLPKAATLEEIRKNLSSFRSRYSESNPTPSSSSDPSSNPISFQELYKRNVTRKLGESPPVGDSGPGRLVSKLSLDAIRQSVRKSGRNLESSGSGGKGVDSLSLSAFTNNLRMKPSDSAGSPTSSTVIGGTGTLPASIFGKETRGEEEGEISEEAKLEFLKIYRHEELGDILRKLRPAAKGQDWFSLRELNDRLMKLREMEEKELREGNERGVTAHDLRDVLIRMKLADDKSKKSLPQKFDILGELGRNPSYMLKPPQEHLVEKYFHPDNMSSAEKLKMELAKVRDEFKMSESDCGSFRVQVAQLTTKIKHLSSVLHKKDKHSRKGLIAMVQKRKRLLKYLRRTDWDSYCFVISKLGLRDNPDTKY